MNLAQEIQIQVAGIPADLQAEILDFIKFIKQRRRALPLFPPSRLEDVAGCLAYKGAAKSVAEMDAGIAEKLRREWRK